MWRQRVQRWFRELESKHPVFGVYLSNWTLAVWVWIGTVVITDRGLKLAGFIAALIVGTGFGWLTLWWRRGVAAREAERPNSDPG